MWYRWYEGRLLSDEEYYNQDTSIDIFGDVFPFVQFLVFISFLGGFGYFGYEIGGKWVMLIGLVLGGFIGYKFNRFFATILTWLILIGVGGGIVALIVYLFLSIE